jgi:hypothetical protein
MDTYNKILKIFDSFAHEHYEVMRIEKGEQDQIAQITSTQEKFPMLYVTPISNSYDDFVNSFTIRVYCYDRLTKDRKNYNNITSKTNQILNDLDVFLRNNVDLSITIESLNYAVPFHDTMMSNVAGWYVDVSLISPAYSECGIPFANTPYLDDICYEGSIQPYQTIIIEDLEGNEIGRTIQPYRPVVKIVVDCKGAETFNLIDEYENKIITEGGDEIQVDDY